jgi:ATP-dependent RNA helicase RhlE
VSFNQFGFAKPIERAIADKGYNQPTAVQKKAIPMVLKGRDVIVAAQTGTGKTAGFTLPLLHNLSMGKRVGKSPRALILAPTRELAAQVHSSVMLYGKHLPFKTCVVFGGVSSKPQIKQLRQGCDIVIATPGRLLDLVNQGELTLSKIEIFVLDEADRMLDMGFVHDIKRVLKLLPSQRQNLLFSATYSKPIKQLASTLLDRPEFVEVRSKAITADRITQQIYRIDKSRKRELLSFLIGHQNWRQVLVFTRTKHGANRLAKQLESDGLKSAAIHGNKSQGARTRALADFKSGKVRVLVATDIAARGLDIEKLPHVVNFDLPNVSEDYVHRIGRTGRASQEGLAVSLVCIDELKLLADIEKLLKYKIPQVVLPGYEPDPTIQAEPIKMGGNKPKGRGASGNRHPVGARRQRRDSSRSSRRSRQA